MQEVLSDTGPGINSTPQLPERLPFPFLIRQITTQMQMDCVSPSSDPVYLFFQLGRAGIGRFRRGSIHATYQATINLLWGVGQRHVDDNHLFLAVAKTFPEGFRFDQLSVNKGVFVSAWLSFLETKNTMFPGIFAGHERRPGRGGDGWDDGFELTPHAVLHDFSQMGQFACRHPGVYEIEGGAIQSNTNDFLPLIGHDFSFPCQANLLIDTLCQ